MYDFDKNAFGFTMQHRVSKNV